MTICLDRRKLLIFIVAYHAEGTIARVIQRIPADQLASDYDIEVLIIDDGSHDRTFEVSVLERELTRYAFPIHVLYNPENQGYGGNQKIGFYYAIENGFDYVALVHGDGQYAPERLPGLARPLKMGEADVVFGSRMIESGDALTGGMPLYKYVGNKILTWSQNWLLNSRLSEFHSGYRLYSTAALKRIPFHLNTNDFHFDTEIIIQLMIANQRIVELPIPTYYGDEICRVNGIGYAWQVMVTTLRATVQKLGIVYDRKYDCSPKLVENAHYLLKLGYRSSHSLAIDAVPSSSNVLDIGCAGGHVAMELRKKGCTVTGMDSYPLAKSVVLDDFLQVDLNNCELPDSSAFDHLMLLDVIEHLNSPEEFMERLNNAVKPNPNIRIIVSTGNIAFIIIRLMLLLGQFNYGSRGILDRTHTRLFTFESIKNLASQAGFKVLMQQGIPVPFPLVIRNAALANMLLKINELLIWISASLFSYQIFLILTPQRQLEHLLRTAVEASNEKLGQFK